MHPNDRNNIILTSLHDAGRAVETAREIPPGYIEVSLSTKGLLGAPKSFHIRNFKMKEILALSMTDPANLPARLISILDGMVYEDVDVASWHEKEVEELMVYLFMTFYRSVIDDLPYPLEASDLEAVKARPNGEAMLRDIEEGRYVPRTTLDIANDVDTYDLPNTFDPHVTITNRKTGFHVTFGYIKYGDQVVIRRWIESLFGEEERSFASVKARLEHNRGVMQRFKDEPEKIEGLQPVDPMEESAYQDFLIRKLQTITEAAHIVSITDYDGQDVSGLDIDEKYGLLSEDARIDAGLIKKLAVRQAKMAFGLKPEVSMRNPITGEVVKRPFSFRIPSLVQAMQLSGCDEYDDGFDDEDQYNVQ